MRSPLVGPAYTARSKDLSNQRCVNLYLESMQAANGAAPAALLGCPGTVSALNLPTGTWRAVGGLDGVMYAIVGNTCYAISAGLAAIALGTITTVTGTAYIETNARQVGFFHAGGLSVWTPASATFAAVNLPYSGTVGVPASLDTFTALSQPGTYNIWQSDSNDMTSWQALNFTTEDENAQNVVALATIHDTIVVFKTGSLCFYVNQGNNGFVFGRLTGIYPRVGCLAAATVKRLGDSIFWLGQHSEGGPQVFTLEGYGPREISTYAIDNTIQAYPTAADAFAFAYIQEGHPFYVLTFPTGNQTFVLDPKETQLLKTPAWHERAGFSNGNFIAYTGSCAIQFNGQIYMGDNNSGHLFLLSLTNYQDNGGIRKWLRSWRAAPSSFATTKAYYLDIQMDTGEGVPPNGNPQLVLRQSFDGLNWSAEQYQSIGQTGQTLADVRFTRLGSTRRGLNSDRILELSSTDVFFPALLGADIG